MKLNDLGKIFLVEECQKIEVNSLLRNIKSELKHSILKSRVSIQDLDIELITSKTGFGGKRYWFKCPQCKKRVGVLFTHPISQNLACRVCLELEYRKRRYKGMVENYS